MHSSLIVQPFFHAFNPAILFSYIQSVLCIQPSTFVRSTLRSYSRAFSLVAFNLDLTTLLSCVQPCDPIQSRVPVLMHSTLTLQPQVLSFNAAILFSCGAFNLNLAFNHTRNHVPMHSTLRSYSRDPVLNDSTLRSCSYAFSLVILFSYISILTLQPAFNPAILSYMRLCSRAFPSRNLATQLSCVQLYIDLVLDLVILAYTQAFMLPAWDHVPEKLGSKCQHASYKCHVRSFLSL